MATSIIVIFVFVKISYFSLRKHLKFVYGNECGYFVFYYTIVTMMMMTMMFFVWLLMVDDSCVEYFALFGKQIAKRTKGNKKIFTAICSWFYNKDYLCFLIMHINRLKAKKAADLHYTHRTNFLSSISCVVIDILYWFHHKRVLVNWYFR